MSEPQFTLLTQHMAWDHNPESPLTQERRKELYDIHAQSYKNRVTGTIDHILYSSITNTAALLLALAYPEDYKRDGCAQRLQTLIARYQPNTPPTT